MFVLLIPIMYFESTIEVKILKEVCPLNVNILIYLILTILFLVLSLFIVMVTLFNISKRITPVNETEEILYLSLAFTLVLLSNLISFVSPEWLSEIVLWLNWRILLLNIVVYIALTEINMLGISIT